MFGAVRGRGVDKRGGNGSNPVGAEAGKEGGDLVGIRYGESAVGAVVLEGEAKES